MNKVPPIDPNVPQGEPVLGRDFNEKSLKRDYWKLAEEEWAEIQRREKLRAYVPNPKRQAAGRLNRLKRKGLTEAGRQKLRDTAVKYKPWVKSTGPKTVLGRRRSANNGRHSQKGETSIRQMKTELRDDVAYGDDLRSILAMLSSGLDAK